MRDDEPRPVWMSLPIMHYSERGGGSPRIDALTNSSRLFFSMTKQILKLFYYFFTVVIPSKRIAVFRIHLWCV